MKTKLNSCSVCNSNDVGPATNLDGKWFVQCFSCGTATANYAKYDQAVAAWQRSSVSVSYPVREVPNGHHRI